MAKHEDSERKTPRLTPAQQREMVEQIMLLGLDLFANHFLNAEKGGTTFLQGRILIWATLNHLPVSAEQAEQLAAFLRPTIDELLDDEREACAQVCLSAPEEIRQNPIAAKSLVQAALKIRDRGMDDPGGDATRA